MAARRRHWWNMPRLTDTPFRRNGCFKTKGRVAPVWCDRGWKRFVILAAQGQIVAVLIYSPDRLSRKYAYQVLLGEELSRCGVDVVYLKSPSGDSPEDQLVVQFQGMIAEYERAQIAERHRRGKRHRAQQGMGNVLSGAPYGYRYVRKTDTSAAYYEVVESEADVVRMVFAIYTQQRFSINAIARLLNERGISTRTGKTRWERSTVWGLLRNPAYEGKACYGKTEQSERQRITRPLRQRSSSSHRSNCHRDRPRTDWIEVAVPALVSEETFALAQEQLSKNKHHSPRRTIEPTLLQGMLVCQQCGYALFDLPQERPSESCTTIDASVPMRIVISKVRCAPTVPYERTTWTSSCGTRSSACWTMEC